MLRRRRQPDLDLAIDCIHADQLAPAYPPLDFDRPKKTKTGSLQYEEANKIEAELRKGTSIKDIADRLNRSKMAVTRYINDTVLHMYEKEETIPQIRQRITIPEEEIKKIIESRK